MDLLIILPAFAVLIGVLVGVHEYGHYKAARTLGVKAVRFSIGFGPVLWSRIDRDGCRWQVSLWPLGGYVMFKGDADATSAAADPRVGSESSPESRREFLALRTPLERMFVLAAGPALNILFGTFLISAVFVGNGRPYAAPVIAGVVQGRPAEAAGIRAGDRLVSVDGVAVRRFDDASGEISLHPNERIRVVVTRGEAADAAELGFDVVPRAERATTLGVTATVGRIGIVSGPVAFERVGPVEAVEAGVGEAETVARQVLVSLGQLATGGRSIEDMGGPVKIAQMSGNAARAGFVTFLVFMSVISVSIGLMNLLPIPLLDGGQIVVCAVEAATRRPIEERTLHWINSFGYAVVTSMFIAVSVSDLIQIVLPLL
jgi:regulator of sigma E protease